MTDSAANTERSFSADFDDFLAFMGQISDGVAVWEQAPWRVAYSNQAFTELAGLAEGVHVGGAASDSLPTAVQSRMMKVLDQFIAHVNDANTTTAVAPRIERFGQIEIRLFRVRPGDDRLVGMVVSPTAKDLPASKDTIDPGRRDPLTGLPDRAFLIENLSAKLAGERAIDRQFAVIFLDLDNFKQVNDAFGHLTGDAVLREASQRIAGCLREGDHVVRYGGDEFVALIEDIVDAHEVEPVVSRIRIAFANPIQVAGAEVSLSLSAGVAFGSSAAGSPEELLEAADRAMYAAKRTAV